MAENQPGGEWRGRRAADEPAGMLTFFTAEIGPRPPGSVREARAAAYLDGRLRRAGLRVGVDSFAPTVDLRRLRATAALAGALAAVLGVWLPWPSLLLAIWAMLALLVMRRGQGAARNDQRDWHACG